MQHVENMHVLIGFTLPPTVALLAVYALLTNPLLLIAIGFLSGGFIAINKFGACMITA